jgi:hypothetical protein
VVTATFDATSGIVLVDTAAGGTASAARRVDTATRLSSADAREDVDTGKGAGMGEIVTAGTHL